MKLIYAKENILIDKYSIFLAGPSPRDNNILSWRNEAINILKELNFDGNVYIPEPRNGIYPKNYIEQIEWEEEGLNKADCILFWIPRDLEKLPGFTTNDEWGYWKCKAPEKASKVKYQLYYARKLNIPFSNSLKETLKNAINRVLKKY